MATPQTADATSTPPEGPPDHEAGLRRDIRALGTLLGQTLVRQEGPELLELVERIRLLMRTDRDAAAAELAALDTISATRLVRAFTTYFYLVNVAEQVHRGRELHAIRLRQGTWLSQAIDRIAAAGYTPGEVAAELRTMSLRPVFTAHPTEAARRSVLTKIRRIASLLDEWERAIGPDGTTRDPVAERRVQRRLEEMVDLLWQTDELRVVRPDVIDEARNAIYYFDNLHHDAVPHTLESLGEELAPHRCRAAARLAPADLRDVDRRRPRRQPERHPGHDARRHRPPARPRDPRHAGRDRRAARRAVLVRAHHRRDAAARAVAGRRPRVPARARASATGA